MQVAFLCLVLLCCTSHAGTSGLNIFPTRYLRRLYFLDFMYWDLLHRTCLALNNELNQVRKASMESF